jgi:DNA repair photolyase
VNTRTCIDILTKSDLVLRDIDLFKQIPNIQICFSLNTLDDTVREKLEPCASSVEKCVSAAKKLHEAGIRTAVFLSPMFPGITDFRAIIAECKSFTGTFWFENLYLKMMQTRIFEETAAQLFVEGKVRGTAHFHKNFSHHDAVFPQPFGQSAGVDAADAGNAIFFQPCRKGCAA